MNKLLAAQSWFYLLLLVVAGGLMYVLTPVLIPFMSAALLAYLADPLTDRLEARGLPRTAAVCVVFLLLISLALGLFFILVPLLQEQLNALFIRLPAMLDWLQNRFVPELARFIGADVTAMNLDAVKETLMSNWRDVGNLLGFVMSRLSRSGQTLAVWITYLLLIPVVTFYLLRDWDRLLARAHDLLPRAYEPLITQLARECDTVLAQFLRGQLLVMCALGLVYSIGLWLAAIEFALLIGMLAGLVSFVPYLGAIVGISVAAMVAFIQYQDVLHLVYVALVFGVGQTLEGMVLSPLLVGDRIGLHPVAVIFAVMAGGQLYGFAGILLALPAAAVIMVLLRYLHRHYLASDLYSP